MSRKQNKKNKKYMKKLLTYSSLAVAAFLYTISLHAQSVKYNTENKTNALAPFKISISILNFEQILTPITAGIMVEGHLKDKLFYNVQFRQGYIRNFEISKDNLITTQKESKGTVFEAGVDWVFRDRIKPGKVKIVTSSSSSSYGTSEKYFRADCDVRKYWALSGGVFEYIRAKYINSDSSEYITSGTTDIKAPKDKFTHLNQNTIGLYVGLVHRKIKKATVAVSDEGRTYRIFYSTKFYLQMLSGVTNVGDILYNGQSYKVDNAKQIPLGYRIGWQWDQQGVVTGFEFGKMPGVILDTPVAKSDFDKISTFLNYMRFTFHFNIYNGDINYSMKLKK